MLIILLLILLLGTGSQTTAQALAECNENAGRVVPEDAGLPISAAIFQREDGAPWNGCLFVGPCEWRTNEAEPTMPLPPEYFRRRGGKCSKGIAPSGVAFSCDSSRELGEFLKPTGVMLNERLTPSCPKPRALTRISFHGSDFLHMPMGDAGECLLLLVRLRDGAQLYVVTPQLDCHDGASALDVAGGFLDPAAPLVLARNRENDRHVLLSFSSSEPVLVSPTEPDDGYIRAQWLPALAALQGDNSDLNANATRPFASQPLSEVGFYLPFLVAAATRLEVDGKPNDTPQDQAVTRWMNELVMSDPPRFHGVFFRAELIP